MSYSVSIRDVVKKFDDFTAVNGVSLEIKEGEFFTLLGPSGCGKTTLLRMIAGFHHIDGGEICFGGKPINQVPAHKRDTGMVFQNYAVFPHMTVWGNVAYGLKAKKCSKKEIAQKVQEALELVQIEKLKDRLPSELSGGQQQRVALARAFVIEPGVLLMDEPLSNLDAKLRVQMRTMIKKLQRRLGITTIYVTHDQEEALAISDRIAVMKDGVIQQVGKPEEIYRKPQNLFVAGFIGTSNQFDGEIVSVDENRVGTLVLEGGYTRKVALRENYTGKVIISVRPEHLHFEEGGLPGTITLDTFLGDYVGYELELSDGKVLELNQYSKEMESVRQPGETAKIGFQPQNVSIYKSPEEAISC